MKKLWSFVGKVLFWLTWPGLWLVLRKSRRTRVLLMCGDEFLVLRGWLNRGLWGLPGGGIHRGEEPIAGLLRELREETGITLGPQQVKLVFEGKHNEYGLRFNYYAFVAKLPIKPKVTGHKFEVAAASWQKIHKPKVRLAQDAKAILDWWLTRN